MTGIPGHGMVILVDMLIHIIMSFYSDFWGCAVDTLQIIAKAQAFARMAREQEVKNVQLPVMDFQEWRQIFDKKDNLAAREEHRTMQKRNYYFKYYLKDQNIDVTMVTCRARDIIDWAKANDHPFGDANERTHVLTHYANQPDPPPSKCVHKRPDTSFMAGLGFELYGSLTIYGERTDQPELMTIVVHTRDGAVVDYLETPIVEHPMEEAFGLVMDFLKKYGVKNAFRDPNVRRPEFCPDCNELLVNVASPKEYEQLKNSEQ